MSDPKTELPSYDALFQPVLDALRELGGSARPAEVRSFIETSLNLSDAALELTKKDGTPLLHNRVQWARFYLAKAGYIDSSKRGVWSLSERGRTARIDVAMTRDIIGEVNRIAGTKQATGAAERNSVPVVADESPTEIDYHEQVLRLLYGISPSAFERLCQRLLRESGFEQVEVTGRSGDGGIDGNGVLQLNPFVSFRVLFQCKRYKGSVGAPAIRDFRGAMAGRADKGIVITTGTFTRDAQREATRDGVPPIELVDGSDLVSLFEELEFGLKPVQTFEVDASFFQSFDD